MERLKIELVTSKDCIDFVKTVSELDGRIVLESSEGFVVNGKSLLGALASVEWNDLWCVSEKDIYSHISQWVK